jgi:hypothetical protein
MADGLPEMRTVQLQRTSQTPTDDQALWAAIRNAADNISWDSYSALADGVLGGSDGKGALAESVREGMKALEIIRNAPFPRADAYNLLKIATELFLEMNCGVATFKHADMTARVQEETLRGVEDPTGLQDVWKTYLKTNPVSGEADPKEQRRVIPYLDIIRMKLSDAPVLQGDTASLAYGVVQKKLRNPAMIELIWSYWMEEGGLAQTMNAILWRFQNRRNGKGRDPLVNMELDPLRPLNNILWGFVQDEQHRLTLARRAYEYDHHYGFSIQGKAVPELRTADSRPRFLQAFHNLLAGCAVFYEQDDDTTRIADGFPILNALKEVHLLLTQGGHNQYGDLPWTARQEMMMTQWVLSRPEMREFLNGRTMVAYAEPWMDRVDAMKTLQGWTDTSITHFRDLAVFGEKILLSVRFGAWSKVTQPQQAANWARYFRAEIQGYLHAYRAATGVDVSKDMFASDSKQRTLALTSPSRILAAREAQAARQLRR